LVIANVEWVVLRNEPPHVGCYAGRKPFPRCPKSMAFHHGANWMAWRFAMLPMAADAESVLQPFNFSDLILRNSVLASMPSSRAAAARLPSFRRNAS
jgi:hypothetical protein